MLGTYLTPVGIVAGIGLVAGVVLVLAAKYMAVSEDEKYELIRALLPGANCGACGFAGCDDYAAKLAAGDVPANLCVPGGDILVRRISRTLGREAVAIVPMSAVVACAGTCDAAVAKMDYRGRPVCAAASLFYRGNMACPNACLGFGDCVAVCKNKALSIKDGVAVVDKKRCTGCGRCATVCPHHVIYMRPQTAYVYVACTSPDPGNVTRKYCKNGCIACHKCEKVCPTGSIKLQNNVAWTKPELCTKCNKCLEACPVGAIHTCLQSVGK